MSRKTIAISEMKLSKWQHQGGICPVCHEPVTCYDELAHRIPQKKWCLAKWGPAIIHHSKNLVLTHPECNSAVSLTNHPVEMDRLAKEIQDELDSSRHGA